MPSISLIAIRAGSVGKQDDRRSGTWARLLLAPQPVYPSESRARLVVLVSSEKDRSRQTFTPRRQRKSLADRLSEPKLYRQVNRLTRIASSAGDPGRRPPVGYIYGR